MKSLNLKNKILFGAALLSLLCLLSCGLPVLESDGSLIFPSFEEYKSIFGAIRGELDFENVPVGEYKALSFTLGNSGNKDLLIEGISFQGIEFDFAGHQSPEFPLAIPGKGEKTFHIGFYPETNGARTGKVIVTAGDITRYITLSGSGVWNVTFSINNTGGKILSPEEVTVPLEAGQKTIQTVDGVLSLSAEPGFLRKLSQWTLVSTSKDPPEFGDIYATDTTVTIKGHTHIRADFLDPWVFFPSGEPTLQGAINAVAGDPTKEGVIIENGAHSIAGIVTVPAGVALYGGYHAALADPPGRKYKTPEDRLETDYRAVLQFDAGAGLRVDSGTGVTIEGLTLLGNAGGGQPVLRVTSGAPLIQYNTITSQNTGPALRTDYSNPIVKYCLISGGNSANESIAVRIFGGKPHLEENTIIGGNTSADYSESYTVWADDSTEAIFYKNTITGGTAGGAEGESFGFFLDWNARPLIVGNNIYGGAAPGDGGMSTGIYFINNGKSTVWNNTINGGEGKGMARALYSAYGTNLYLRYNLITNKAEGTGKKYGIYFGANGRVRRLIGNLFSNVDTAHQYTFITNENITDVDDLNSTYNAGGDFANSDTTSVTQAPVPTELGKQEWE